MERALEIRTPESIAIRYELAGLGSRFLAVFIDLVIQTAVYAVLFVLYAFARVRDAGVVRALHVPARAADSILAAIIVAIGFAIFFGYFIIAEWRFGGRTVGKRAVGIRVVRDGGYALDALGSVIRNFVRVLEVLLGFYLVSAIVTIVSKENKRLGDYAAGTLVIRDIRLDSRVLTAPTVVSPMQSLDGPTRTAIDRYFDGAQPSPNRRERASRRSWPPASARNSHRTHRSHPSRTTPCSSASPPPPANPNPKARNLENPRLLAREREKTRPKGGIFKRHLQAAAQRRLLSVW